MSARVCCDLRAILNFLSTGSHVCAYNHPYIRRVLRIHGRAGGHRLGEKKNENAPPWRSCGRAGSCLRRLSAITFSVLSFVGVDVASATPAAAASPNPNLPVGCSGPSRLCRLHVQRLLQGNRHTRVRIGSRGFQPDDRAGADQANNSANPTTAPTAAPLGTDTASQPPVNQPPVNQPSSNQPSEQPTAGQPTAGQPTAGQPTASNQPSSNQPPVNQPPSQPTAGQPTADQPTAGQPTAGHAGHLHPQAANPTTVTAAGQTVTYTYAIENTGNVTLHNVGVTDAGAPVPRLEPRTHHLRHGDQRVHHLVATSN